MIVNWKKDGKWVVENLINCPVCDSPIEVNKYKKEDKHPDYKCSNRNKDANGEYECGMGFWKPKDKSKPTQIQPISPDGKNGENAVSLLKVIVDQNDKTISILTEILKKSII